MGRYVILAMAVACASLGLAQTVTVQPSTVPGVEITAPGAPDYAVSVDQVLPPPRSGALNAWLPYGVALRNSTQQNILGVALRWSAVMANGATESGTSMSLTQTPSHQIAPGQVAVALPNFGEVLVQGDASRLPARLRLNPPAESAADPDVNLAHYQTARTVEVVLDGVVFASGQFMGPDTANEYEKWLADTTVPGEIGAKVLAMKAAGESTGSIVAWLEQAARSEGSTDEAADMRGRVAHRLLQTYRQQGEAALYQHAQAGSPLASLHLYR